MTDDQMPRRRDLDTTPPPRSSARHGAPAWLDDDGMARFTHSARLPMHARAQLDASIALEADAHFIGCTPQRLLDIRDRHRSAVSQAASSLLNEDAFAAELERLVGVTGPRIVVLGDSVTADSLGWAELLAEALRQSSVPALNKSQVANLSVSGLTTAEAIPMFDLVVEQRPTSVVTMLGTNDGRRQGARADVRCVSTTETHRNLQAMRQLTELDADARFISIVPPPMDERRYSATTPPGGAVRFSDEDMTCTADEIRAALPDLIDLPALLDGHLGEDFWLPDGLHPALPGHIVMLRAITAGIAGLSGIG